jgi:hypothetical protein
MVIARKAEEEDMHLTAHMLLILGPGLMHYSLAWLGG